jgi:hypothetical protein
MHAQLDRPFSQQFGEAQIRRGVVGRVAAQDQKSFDLPLRHVRGEVGQAGVISGRPDHDGFDEGHRLAWFKVG